LRLTVRLTVRLRLRWFKAVILLQVLDCVSSGTLHSYYPAAISVLPELLRVNIGKKAKLTTVILYPGRFGPILGVGEVVDDEEGSTPNFYPISYIFSTR
jgi:hypothetical protein